MALLLDLFGYLSIVVHGFTIASQSVALGSVLFIALLLRPLAPRLGAAGQSIERTCIAIAGWSAMALVLCEVTTIVLQGAVLIGTVDLSVSEVLGADFAIASIIKATAAALIALMLFGRGQRASVAALLSLAVIELAAATLTTHAEARLDNRTPLLVVEFLHQLGAAIWIGGIPCFLVALNRIQNAPAWLLVGKRFSHMSMAGVACILVSGITMSVVYIGSWQAFYGTAYGVMVGAKIAMFLLLLALGGGNYLLIERLRQQPATPIIRLKRFAEVEVGIGVAIFFAAASLTSVPPAADLTQDRVSWSEIVQRNTPEWPRFVSPDHDKLALPALQQKLDAEAAHHAAAPQVAFVPGSGELPPRNAADIAWSEYNHHWSGLFVLAIGILSLLNAAGVRWAKHWPLMFLLLAVFLFLRSDPEVWPLGEEGFFTSFRDIEVLAAPRVRRADCRIRHLRVARARGARGEAMDAVGVPAAVRRRRRVAADAQSRDRQFEGPVADRTHAHAACGHRHRGGMVAVAGAAAGPGSEPHRMADRALAMAGVFRAGGADAAELPRGVVSLRLKRGSGDASMAEFQTPTQREFDAASRRGARRMQQSLLAVGARYDRRANRVIISLNNGTIVGFPLSALTGLEHASPDELRTIEVEAGGYGLRVANLDADISVPRLLEEQLGSTAMKVAQARAAASRVNGRLGGRPPKPRAA